MGRKRQPPRSILSIACLLAAHSFDCAAFTIATILPTIPHHTKHHVRYQQRSPYPIITSLHASKSPPLPDTTDPFLLLGISPTTDAKEIKRAYRKRAMQYHPDVLLTADSSEEDRKRASDDFARINAAYEMLSGGGKGIYTEKKTTSGGYSYQPPHRRPSSYEKSSNWEDYMPNYREENAKYDAEGDSFGAIFTDLLTGVAAGAAGVAGMGRGGIMGDLIDFLERNVDGFQSGYDDDISLERFLASGSFDEVANEMDETDVLVSSLEKKLLSVEDEMMQLNADLGYATKYSEKIGLEERIAELKAREKVVKGYLKKGRSRLVRLRERYKELIVQGRGGRGYESSSSSASTRSSSYSDQSHGPIPTPTPAPTRAEATSSTTSDSSKSWRTQGFGGTGRRSSSSRRSSRRRSEATSDSSSGSGYQTTTQQKETPQKSTSDQAYNSSSSSRDQTARNSSVSRPTSTEPWTPPHRRSQSSTQQVAEEKRRLRELQVDDEFERLKREMGM